MHLFGKWHARRCLFFHKEGRLSISIWVCVIFELKKSKAFNDQVNKCFPSKIYSKTSTQTRKTSKQDNIHVIDIIMFYENNELLIFKLLGIVVYWFLENYACVDYLCLKKDFFLSQKGFEYTSFDEISGIGIPEILLNIVSCYGFLKSTIQH